MKKLLAQISDQTGEIILAHHPLTGGDISNAFLLKTHNSRYFLKTNRSVDALKMFRAEKAGLEAIAETDSIAVPVVLGLGIAEGTAYLLLEYIESKSASTDEMELLGKQLAQLHRSPIELPGFGFQTDNFIGSLPQSNTFH
ncbi:MAG: fructosamine kinase family protein, partial [Flavobacteriaceae bacterium]|nr:fructosamine kinase family protein [Flavobacteriaceae bacterium]